MLTTTRGIVLRQTRYGESSLILQVYTPDLGSVGLVVSGVRSARSRAKAALYQPMNLLELVLYVKEGRDLHRVKEARFAHVYARLPFEPERSAVGLFLAEVLLRALREDGPHPELHAFSERAFQVLDGCTRGLSGIPCAFLLGLSGLMGFAPQGRPGPETPWFDLREGGFCRARPLHGQALNPDEGPWLERAAAFDWDDPRPLDMAPAQRQVLLDRLLAYVACHVAGFGELRSTAVLRALSARA
jgi:DNA repair protein RecO (recombination protein O)